MGTLVASQYAITFAAGPTNIDSKLTVGVKRTVYS
jgi:hypothetical protein